MKIKIFREKVEIYITRCIRLLLKKYDNFENSEIINELQAKINDESLINILRKELYKKLNKKGIEELLSLCKKAGILEIELSDEIEVIDFYTNNEFTEIDYQPITTEEWGYFLEKKYGKTNVLAKITQCNDIQYKIVNSIKNPNSELVVKAHPHDYTLKGNYGEMMVDVDLEETGHIKRISCNRVLSLNDPMHHGIDGIYENLSPPPKYLIVDSKYLGSEVAKTESFAPKMNKSKKGRELGDSWIKVNIKEQFMDEEGKISEENKKIIIDILDAIDFDDTDIFRRIGAKVDNKSNITYYQYNCKGEVLKRDVQIDNKIKKQPVIWKPKGDN